MYYKSEDFAVVKQVHKELCDKLAGHSVLTMVIGPIEKGAQHPTVAVATYINDKKVLDVFIDVLMLHSINATSHQEPTAPQPKDSKSN